MLTIVSIKKHDLRQKLSERQTNFFEQCLKNFLARIVIKLPGHFLDIFGQKLSER